MITKIPLKSIKINVIFIMFVCHLHCIGNEIDTLYNEKCFIVFFDTKDSTTHFLDTSNNFHHIIANETLYYMPFGNGLPLFHFVPKIVKKINNNYYFSFSQTYSIHDIDYSISFFYRYAQIDKKFEYLKLSDHQDENFDFLLGITSAHKQPKIQIKIYEKQKVTYLKVKAVIYPEKKGRPSHLIKIYKETDYITPIDNQSRSYFRRIFFKMEDVLFPAMRFW